MIIRPRRHAVTAPVAQKQPEFQPVAEKEMSKKKVKKISNTENTYIPVEEKAKKILEEIEEEVLQEDKI